MSDNELMILEAMIKRYYLLNYFASAVSILIILFISCSPPAHATPDYAEDTKQGCLICHIDEDGGSLNDQGLEFSASGYLWPPGGGYRILGPVRKPVRLVIGAIHILAAFLWFGTILYVHILLKPKYAERGLPKGEVLLGMISMWAVGITGVLLTISKIRSVDVLYSSPWGAVLSVKILFYLIMITSALFVVLFVGPRLKKKATAPVNIDVDVFDPLTLSACDGKEGRPSYVAYRGNVYDVSSLKLWKGGVHMKHAAGNDLTDYLAKAPHGEEKLQGLNIAGTYDAGKQTPKTFAQKAFYFIAYMNLIIVFFVLLTIAYWRWGL